MIETSDISVMVTITKTEIIGLHLWKRWWL